MRTELPWNPSQLAISNYIKLNLNRMLWIFYNVTVGNERVKAMGMQFKQLIAAIDNIRDNQKMWDNILNILLLLYYYIIHHLLPAWRELVHNMTTTSRQAIKYYLRPVA